MPGQPGLPLGDSYTSDGRRSQADREAGRDYYVDRSSSERRATLLLRHNTGARATELGAVRVWPMSCWTAPLACIGVASGARSAPCRCGACVRVVQGKGGARPLRVTKAWNLLALPRRYWRTAHLGSWRFPAKCAASGALDVASAQRLYCLARHAASITNQSGIHTLRHRCGPALCGGEHLRCNGGRAHHCAADQTGHHALVAHHDDRRSRSAQA